MSNNSKTVIEALDGIRNALHNQGQVTIDYPLIANGPNEHVLAFNNDETIVLKDPDAHSPFPYFSSHGVLTNLQHVELADSRLETTFPVDPSNFVAATLWPHPQPEPFDRPPFDTTNALTIGPSKQSYFFNGGVDLLVTIGPSVPKIVALKNGGAQFWVSSIGTISQGKGKYAGAKGMSVFTGSGYFAKWPEALPDQLQILKKGFKARVGTYFKFVLPPDIK